MSWKYTSDPNLWEETVESREMPLADMAKTYIDWINDKDYAVLQHKETGKIISCLQSKRGNKAYARAQKKKLNPIQEAMQHFQFDYQPSNGSFRNTNIRYTRALFFTLDINPNAYSMQDAWLMLKGTGSVQNKFRAYMTKLFRSYHGQQYHYGSHSRKEAHASGYPHIHMIVLLDKPVRVIKHRSRTTDRYTWRIADFEGLVKPLKDAWSKYTQGSYLDVQGIVDMRISGDSGVRVFALNYCMKYVVKDVDVRNPKAVYTHMMLKFFRMRDIFSKSFQRMLDIEVDTRHDNIKLELKLINKRIEYLESLSNHWGWESSPRRSELARLYQERELLKQRLKPPSKWRYESTVTLNTMREVTKFFLLLEEYNACDNKDSQNFISQITKFDAVKA